MTERVPHVPQYQTPDKEWGAMEQRISLKERGRNAASVIRRGAKELPPRKNRTAWRALFWLMAGLAAGYGAGYSAKPTTEWTVKSLNVLEETEKELTKPLHLNPPAFMRDFMFSGNVAHDVQLVKDHFPQGLRDSKFDEVRVQTATAITSFDEAWRYWLAADQEKGAEKKYLAEFQFKLGIQMLNGAIETEKTLRAEDEKALEKIIQDDLKAPQQQTQPTQHGVKHPPTSHHRTPSEK